MPGLWIEQDQFVVRKVRLPTQALITTEDYTRHPENLWLPRTRNLSWGPNSLQMHVSSVKSFGRQTKAQDQLKVSSLDPKNPGVNVRWPDSEIIREFYLRFR